MGGRGIQVPEPGWKFECEVDVLWSCWAGQDPDDQTKDMLLREIRDGARKKFHDLRGVNLYLTLSGPVPGLLYGCLGAVQSQSRTPTDGPPVVWMRGWCLVRFRGHPRRPPSGFGTETTKRTSDTPQRCSVCLPRPF